MASPNASRDALIAEMNRLNWVHRIDLGHGLITPGRWGAHNPLIMRALDAIDFRGKKVLDIGCWDGLFSFEAEKRGAAEVYATDLVTHRHIRETIEQPTFRFAHDALKSRAKYFPDVSVYDVGRLGVDDFDVVIYAGVYYHIKDPLRSFATLRRVMKDGGVILVEGAVLDSEECFAKFFYRDTYLGDDTNWWVPTVPCLRQWVECNFFEIEQDYGRWDAGCGNLRYTLTSRATRRPDPQYVRPDEDLKTFDLNDYPPEIARKPGRLRRLFGLSR